MPDIAELHRQLAEVAPIDGVSVGDWEDRETWRVDFSDGATVHHMHAAQDVLQKFDHTKERQRRPGLEDRLLKLEAMLGL